MPLGHSKKKNLDYVAFAKDCGKAPFACRDIKQSHVPLVHKYHHPFASSIKISETNLGQTLWKRVVEISFSVGISVQNNVLVAHPVV